MIIDCDTCEVRGPACGDCMVTALRGGLAPVELDDEHRRAIEVLAGSGLVPPLRLVVSVPTGPPEPGVGYITASGA